MDNSVYIADAAKVQSKTPAPASKNRRYRSAKKGKRAVMVEKTITANYSASKQSEFDKVISFADISARGNAILSMSHSTSSIAEVAISETFIPSNVTVVNVPDSYAYKEKHVYNFMKRMFDIISSGIAIVLLSPLMLIVAFLVKVTSKGSIFYVSDRVGKNGKTFKFLKFRSMCTDADKKLEDLLDKNEAEGGVIFKMKDDPRITKFGKFIRKTSLDELPQLFNIFIGNMTVVGPRPCTTREYALYSDRDKKRLQVKQGLTCVWQCSGRSNTTFDEQIEMDIDYIQHRGFWFDIWLVLKTVVAVFRHDGAL